MSTTPEELDAIYQAMLLKPNYAYIRPDGSELFILSDDGAVVRVEGEGLHLMSNDEINQFLIEKFSE